MVLYASRLVIAAAISTMLTGVAACASDFRRVPVDAHDHWQPDQLINPRDVQRRSEVFASSRAVSLGVTERYSCDVLRTETRQVGEYIYRGDEKVDSSTQAREVAQVVPGNVPCQEGPARGVLVDLEVAGQRVSLGRTDSDGRLWADLADVLGTRNGIAVPPVASSGTLWIGGVPDQRISLAEWQHYEQEYERDLTEAKLAMSEYVRTQAVTIETASLLIGRMQSKNPRVSSDPRVQGVMQTIVSKARENEPRPHVEPPRAGASLSWSVVAKVLIAHGGGLALSVGLLVGDMLAVLVEFVKEHSSWVCGVTAKAVMARLASWFDERASRRFARLAGVIGVLGRFGCTPFVVLAFLVSCALDDDNGVDASLEAWIAGRCKDGVAAIPGR